MHQVYKSEQCMKLLVTCKGDMRLLLSCQPAAASTPQQIVHMFGHAAGATYRCALATVRLQLLRPLLLLLLQVCHNDSGARMHSQ
jgi:hypothetical protein